MSADAALGVSDEQLEADARYARERYRLYRAKSHGPTATNEAHLRELEQQLTRANHRLAKARASAVDPAE